MISVLAPDALAESTNNSLAFNTSLVFNVTVSNDSRSEYPLAEGGGELSHLLPGYIRTTSMAFCIAILGIGVIGNVMVPLVILKSKDMRNSTNIFLMNLSIADLMVLLVCTPTVLVEVNSKPETWVLGQEMCKAVPFVEQTVAHASVLTILAISFERYYAICKPLKAGYVCTKERALLICVLAWAVAALFTSPILFIPEYGHFKATSDSYCIMPADTNWSKTFFLMTISLFFLVPLLLLSVVYALIARRLMADPGTSAVKSPETSNLRARKHEQVVLMLGTVVMSFFLCLLPFRIFIITVIFVSGETLTKLGFEGYYILLYICRIMLYLNSAINPILYNLMSSKFRDGFMRLCGLRRRDGHFLRRRRFTRSSTLNTTTTASLSLSGSRRYHHGVVRSCSRLSLDSRTLIFSSPRGSPTTPQQLRHQYHLNTGNGAMRRNVMIRSTMDRRYMDRSSSHFSEDIQPESYV